MRLVRDVSPYPISDPQRCNFLMPFVKTSLSLPLSVSYIGSMLLQLTC